MKLLLFIFYIKIIANKSDKYLYDYEILMVKINNTKIMLYLQKA